MKIPGSLCLKQYKIIFNSNINSKKFNFSKKKLPIHSSFQLKNKLSRYLSTVTHHGNLIKYKPLSRGHILNKYKNFEK